MVSEVGESRAEEIAESAMRPKASQAAFRAQSLFFKCISKCYSYVELIKRSMIAHGYRAIQNRVSRRDLTWFGNTTRHAKDT